MADSKIATSKFLSHLKSSNSTHITWDVEEFKRFTGLLREAHEFINQISCRFQGNLDSSNVPITWRLYFYCYRTFDLILKMESGPEADKVFIYANIVVLNSENVTIFSNKSELTPMSVTTELKFDLGNWADFISRITDGPLTINCTIDQMSWKNVETPSKVSLVGKKNEIEFFATCFKNLLESGDNADVSLKLSNGKIVPAHKAILSARSPVFNKMFTIDMKESKDNTVDLVDIGEEALTELLSYIYTGELNLKGKSTQSILELIDAAEKYGLTNMKELCNENLPECCDAENAIDFLKVAKLHGLKHAESLISSYMELHIASIIESISFGK